MGYMKAMLMDIQEYLRKHPEKVAGDIIHLQVETFEGPKWIDYKITDYDLGRIE